ncbi:uracil-DNA glycosylase [Patescibacteria group bacterium]|nr:uracil-DNA glycosylase [Patescibacteria group bacterium]
MDDYPKSLGNENIRKKRTKLLKLKHFLPLTIFVNEIRKEQGVTKKIPYFDSFDGGVFAECLFVLEAPGSKAVRSGFVSRNNPDETAKNFFEMNNIAGIERDKTIIWNIIPWYIGSGNKIRPAKQNDINKGIPYLTRLLPLLPHLRVIVLVGRKAQKIHAKLQAELNGNYKNITILTCFHPSPVFVNRKPQNKQLIVGQLKKINSFLKE